MEQNQNMTGKTEDQFQKTAFRVSIISIIGNLALTLLKLLAGILARSHAMVGDAVHSASDILSTVVVMIGVHFAGKESDKEHPYGHERMECVAAILLSVALFLTGIFIGWKSLMSILNPNINTAPGVLALIAAVVSIVSKEAMFRYTAFYAKKIDSGALMADAWHHRSDALSSIGALIGIAGARLGFLWMDGAAGCVIFLFIVKTAYDIFMDAVNKMVDSSCDAETEEAIRASALRDSRVMGVDMLQTRVFANKVYVDMEICADGGMTLEEAHEIAESVHHTIETDFPKVKHIMVHVNPFKK